MSLELKILPYNIREIETTILQCIRELLHVADSICLRL